MLREVSKYLEGLTVAKDHRPALLTQEEFTALDNKRHAYHVLAWVVRDAMTLVKNKHVGEMRMKEVIDTVGKLRALCEDVPMFTRVQLPFVTVSMVAVVVHLTIFQLMYVSASYIGTGVAERELGLKVVAGLFSVCVVPAVFLSILKMQSLLSNPFGKFSSFQTDFPVSYFKSYCDAQLDNIHSRLNETEFRRVGAGDQDTLDALAKPPDFK